MKLLPDKLDSFQHGVKCALLEIRSQLVVLEEDLGNIVEMCDGGMFTLAMNDTRKYAQFSIDALDLLLDSFPYYGVFPRADADAEVTGNEDLL